MLLKNVENYVLCIFWEKNNNNKKTVSNKRRIRYSELHNFG